MAIHAETPLIPYDGLLSIASEEALVLAPYNDRGTPAWGFGHQDKSLKPGMKISRDDAWALFIADVNTAARGVLKVLKVAPTPNQLAAHVSAAHNYGVTGWTEQQGVVALINEGREADAIALWHSLTKNEGRRDREAEIYATGVYPASRFRIKLSTTGNLDGHTPFSWSYETPPTPEDLGYPPKVTGSVATPPAAAAQVASTPAPLVSAAAPLAAAVGYKLKWLPDVLRAAGLTVVEQPGWQTRGHGDVGSIAGVILHHTAGPKSGNAPSLGVVTDGRPGLAGPLAQLVLGRDGTFYVVAAGRCYHAGAGSWQGITAGNTRFIGIEAENTGLSNDTPWPAVQMDAYRRGVAAILKYIGAKPIMAAGHKEYALPKGRKTDPDFDMVGFRNALSALISGAPAPKPTVPAAQKLKVTGVKPDTLTLRSGPGKQNQSIGKMPEGTVVTKLSESGAWFEIVTPAGARGWASSAYLKAA